jgi:hypothetical protein
MVVCNKVAGATQDTLCISWIVATQYTNRETSSFVGNLAALEIKEQNII